MRRSTPVGGENVGDAAAAAPAMFFPVPRRVARIDSSCSRFREDILNVLTEVGELEEDHSSPSSFFCGSPPSRPANPMIDDPQFHEQEPEIRRCVPSTYNSSPSPSRPSGGCLIVKHDIKPTVRIEGFDCFNRQQRRGCGISAVA